jgi:thiamine-phosphate pyrophosphorylase
MASEGSRLRGLYAITAGTVDTARLCRQVEAAIEGGAALVQYRSKDLDAELRLAQARALVQLCRGHGVPLIVNDSIELAVACGADGVHVGRGDAGARAARAALPRGIVGVSCYADVALARDAADAGADYIGIGSVFPSPTKPHAIHAPLELIARAHDACGLPVAAIGGITPSNAASVVAAGAAMLAVISALFEADDVAGAARGFARLFETSTPGPLDARTQPQPL